MQVTLSATAPCLHPHVSGHPNSTPLYTISASAQGASVSATVWAADTACITLMYAFTSHHMLCVCNWDSSAKMAVHCQCMKHRQGALAILEAKNRILHKILERCKKWILQFAQKTKTQKENRQCWLQLDGAGRSFEQPLELSFQEQYGTIERHIWFGDGYILLAFSTGTVLVVSTHVQEIHEEVHSHQCFDTGITDLAYCPQLNKVGQSLLELNFKKMTLTLFYWLMQTWFSQVHNDVAHSKQFVQFCWLVNITAACGTCTVFTCFH